MPDRDWKTTLEYVESASGRVFDMTFAIRESAPPTFDNLDGATVASDLASWLSTQAKALTMNTVKLQRVHVNRGGPYGPDAGAPAMAGESIIGATCTGASAGGISLPHGLCARCTVYTDLASKRGRGRFHAPWPDSMAALSAPDTFNTSNSYYTAFVTFCNTVLGGHDSTHDLVVHHYSLRVHSRVDNATRDAKSVSVRTGVSYLRSRLSAP